MSRGVASSDSQLPSQPLYARWFPSPYPGQLYNRWTDSEGLCLEVVVGGKVLEEVTLLLHDAVELVNVDLAIAITVGLVDHVLELLIVDVLTEPHGHAGEVAEGDLVGVVVIEQLEHL